MQLTNKQKRQKIWFETKDLLAGAAFPLMLQLIFSASVIMFAGYSEDTALQIVALLFGEALLIGAYIIFGRTNGITAFRRTVQNEKKREINSSELKVIYKTGEYALYKGFVIGLISTVPYILFQLIQCIAPNSVCDFVLKYAFGWASYPFVLISESPAVGELTQWLNFLWVIFPVCIHAAAYFWGGKAEAARQKKLAEAQEYKGKRRR